MIDNAIYMLVRLCSQKVAYPSTSSAGLHHQMPQMSIHYQPLYHLGRSFDAHR